MPTPKLKTRLERSPRPFPWTNANIKRRLHRADDFHSGRVLLQLNQFEDRTVPSAAPFHAPTSEAFANSLLTSSAAIRNELVLIDPTVPDYQSLIRDLQLNGSANRHFEIIVLSANRNGLDQVSDLLANRQDIDAIHFVTHGTGGAMRLGNSWVDSTALNRQASQVSEWSRALTADADLLFYGCDVAGNLSGQQFLQMVRQLTGADVAASSDRTGAALRGGNWDLEYRAGIVETTIAFSESMQRTYGGTLALFVVTSTNDSGAGTLRAAITQANAMAGTDTISFGFSGPSRRRIQLSSALPTITGRLMIDATTMSGYAGSPLIELDGSLAGAGANGLLIQAASTIRGLSIFGFSGYGVLVNTTAANGTTLQANYIGTDGWGVANLGNGLFGIAINNTANVVIGGNTASQRNIISANIGGGVLLQGTSTTGGSIQGNWIGLQSDGISKLGNLGHGILLQTNASNNFIGGAAAGMGNEIVYSSGDGIRALGSGTGGNAFLGNSIHDNGGLGIDLNGDGPSPNDPGDPDSGANALKNFPVLTMVLTNGTQVTISGTYNSTSSNNYRIELFASSMADPSGYGEGARYLGFVTVTTNSSGNATFSTTITATVLDGEYVSGIATDLTTNNSSEFSLAMKAVMPQVIVTPTIGLITTEAGGQSSFSVRLSSQPLSPVTINITTSNPAEGMVSISSLTFTTANWNIDQIVTITGVDDFVIDGNVSYTIILSPATSADANYNGLDATDVSVTNIDNDTAGVIVTPTNGLFTTEAGSQSTFSVRLSSQPQSPVTINIASSNPAEGTVSVTSLTFTAANWNIDQVVTITGVDDLVVDGNVNYTIILGPATSSDADYNGLDPADLFVTNFDDETAGIIVAPNAGLFTTEAGGTASFGVRLTSQPVNDVIVTLQSSNINEGTISVTTLMFNAGNWATQQFVVVTGVNDFIDDGDQLYFIRFGLTSSVDPQYDGLAIADVAVTNADDDVSGFMIVGNPPGLVNEYGTSTFVYFVLTSQPVAPVTLRLTSALPGEIFVVWATVTFDSSNWSVPQPVQLRGVPDDVVDDDAIVTIFISSVSFDPLYDRLSGNLVITNANVDIDMSDSSLSTAVNHGAGVPSLPEQDARPADHPLAMSNEILGPQTVAQGLTMGGSSGSAESPEENVNNKHDTPIDGSSDWILAKRPGLSPTGRQRMRPMISAIPANFAEGGVLPTIRFETIHQSMGKMDRDLQEVNNYRTATVQITAGTVAMASAGLVLWSLNGVAWIASAMASSLPSWSAIDPLVLLARQPRDDEDDEDSLTHLIESVETV